MLVAETLGALSLSHAPLLAHPSHTLWHEVGVWLDVRNAVAHEGLWAPQPHVSSDPSAQRRVTEAFETVARGGGLDAGTIAYTDTCSAAAEAVLRAAVLGTFVIRRPDDLL